MADVSEAVAHILVVESTHNVARISVEFIEQIDLSGDAHRVLQELTRHARCPVWCISLNRQVQVERLSDTILVGQIENLIIRTDVQVLADHCIYIIRTLRCDDVAVLAQREP